MTNDQDKPQRPILKKLRRPNMSCSPTGSANAFFGRNQTAKILKITNELIEYINNDAVKDVIRIDECKNNYFVDAEVKYIGRRSLLNSTPWVEFFDEKKTRFEFESFVIAHNTLLSKLADLGFWTMDLD